MDLVSILSKQTEIKHKKYVNAHDWISNNLIRYPICIYNVRWAIFRRVHIQNIRELIGSL